MADEDEINMADEDEIDMVRDYQLVLSEIDAAKLRENGLLFDAFIPGMQYLHLRRFYTNSDHRHSNIPLTGGSQLTAIGSGAFGLIPILMYSPQSLRYIGLSTAKADELWHIWTHWPETGPRRRGDAGEYDSEDQVDFTRFVIGSILSCDNTAHGEEDDAEWWECLNRCGIIAELQESMMHADQRATRLLGSCHD